MDEKLTPPAEVEVIEAKPAVEEVEPAKANDMLPDVPPELLLDLRNRADSWANQVATMKPKTPEYTEQVRAIQQVARQEIQSTANASSRFLDTSLRQAKMDGNNSQAKVASSLVDLRNKVDELAPNNQSFASRLARFLPGGRQVQRYFRSYESNQEQLNSILMSLDQGQDMLRKDNAALATERRALWDAMIELKKLGTLLAELDRAVTEKVDALRTNGEVEAANSMEQEVLFAVRQRRADVQTQAAVSVQSYLSMDLVQDNNLKLIDGVERAKTTTMTALRTAVVVAQALENQKVVLDQIDAVNSTTNAMIEDTSRMLRDNTARVQEQAVNSGVNLETLQRAYDNVFATIDSIEEFRRTANERFSQTIDALEGQLERATPYLERSREHQLQMEGTDSRSSNQLTTGGPAALLRELDGPSGN